MDRTKWKTRHRQRRIWANKRASRSARHCFGIPQSYCGSAHAWIAPAYLIQAAEARLVGDKDQCRRAVTAARKARLTDWASAMADDAL